MELEGGEQANDRLRPSLGNFSQRVMLREIEIGGNIETACGLYEFSALHQIGENLPGIVHPAQIPGPHDLRSCQLQNLGCIMLHEKTIPRNIIFRHVVAYCFGDPINCPTAIDSGALTPLLTAAPGCQPKLTLSFSQTVYAVTVCPHLRAFGPIPPGS